MSEESRDPAGKMRTLLKGGKTSPMTKLPKRDSNQESDKNSAKPEARPVVSRERLSSLPKSTVRTSSAPVPVAGSSRHIFGPSLWTLASLISLTVNALLVVVLGIVLVNVSRFDPGNMFNLGNGLLGGLYANFEKMDRAHITSNVEVTTVIPVKFDLQLNQQTNVVLSQDVTIDNALVTVKTGGLNITNALTTIVLPKGTNLPIVLNLTVPVDTTVPVVLNVPVDIPLNQTQLHEPFTGLQEVVRPFYCMLNQGALNLDGRSICN